MISPRIKLALALLCGLLPAAAQAGNLVYHGGPVIISAKVVNIFWGPSFAPGGADNAYATTLQAFRNQFGTTRQYNIITQYYGSTGQHISLANLGAGTADWFDTSTPPINVTETVVRTEIQRYLSTHPFDINAIYEIFLPRTSYSINGMGSNGGSCGSPLFEYCDYHNYFTSGANTVKYAVQPYPSCSSCKVAGLTDVQDQEILVAGAVRNTVTDPLLTSWYDATGLEGQDKCLWSPPPFLSGSFYYPYYWSNLASACVSGL